MVEPKSTEWCGQRNQKKKMYDEKKKIRGSQCRFALMVVKNPTEYTYFKKRHEEKNAQRLQ